MLHLSSSWVLLIIENSSIKISIDLKLFDIEYLFQLNFQENLTDRFELIFIEVHFERLLLSRFHAASLT